MILIAQSSTAWPVTTAMTSYTIHSSTTAMEHNNQLEKPAITMNTHIHEHLFYQHIVIKGKMAPTDGCNTRHEHWTWWLSVTAWWQLINHQLTKMRHHLQYFVCDIMIPSAEMYGRVIANRKPTERERWNYHCQICEGSIVTQQSAMANCNNTTINYAYVSKYKAKAQCNAWIGIALPFLRFCFATCCVAKEKDLYILNLDMYLFTQWRYSKTTLVFSNSYTI